MQYYRFNYLATAAKRLIPKWAKNWKHPEQIPEFREAFRKMSPDEREKRLRAARRVGWRLWLAFHAEDEIRDFVRFLSGSSDMDVREYEREWLLYEARRINAEVNGSVVLAARPEDGDDKVSMPRMDNALDSLLRFAQTHLIKRMAICPRQQCEKKYYFREPGRHGQKYCGLRCSEIVNREGKLRWYHESPESRKNRD